jgi:hypothetical protein
VTIGRNVGSSAAAFGEDAVADAESAGGLTVEDGESVAGLTTAARVSVLGAWGSGLGASIDVIAMPTAASEAATSPTCVRAEFSMNRRHAEGLTRANTTCGCVLGARGRSVVDGRISSRVGASGLISNT